MSGQLKHLQGVQHRVTHGIQMPPEPTRTRNLREKGVLFAKTGIEGPLTAFSPRLGIVWKMRQIQCFWVLRTENVEGKNA